MIGLLLRGAVVIVVYGSVLGVTGFIRTSEWNFLRDTARQFAGPRPMTGQR
jgi:hypothetical protein